MVNYQYDMPLMVLKNYEWNGDHGMAAIYNALEQEYRHIEIAQTYDTETECGNALIRSKIVRSDVFVMTKISTNNFSAGALLPSLQKVSTV